MELKELGELDDEEWEEEGDSVGEGNSHESEADKVEKDSEEGFEHEGEYHSDGEPDDDYVPDDEKEVDAACQTDSMKVAIWRHQNLFVRRVLVRGPSPLQGTHLPYHPRYRHADDSQNVEETEA